MSVITNLNDRSYIVSVLIGKYLGLVVAGAVLYPFKGLLDDSCLHGNIVWLTCV